MVQSKSIAIVYITVIVLMEQINEMAQNAE